MPAAGHPDPRSYPMSMIMQVGAADSVRVKDSAIRERG
jgi:hypothetical protein